MENNDSKYDYGYQQDSGARGLGSYVGKAPTVRDLYRVDDTLLREVTTYKGTVYELVLDDEVYNRFPSLKEATVWFIDFAGITKAKLKKAACA